MNENKLKADVFIDGRKIIQVGQDLEVPLGAKIIKAGNNWLVMSSDGELYNLIKVHSARNKLHSKTEIPIQFTV